jgi:hypothetical protein
MSHIEGKKDGMSHIEEKMYGMSHVEEKKKMGHPTLRWDVPH